jgi:hypothetical protein
MNSKGNDPKLTHGFWGFVTAPFFEVAKPIVLLNGQVETWTLECGAS